MEKSPNTAGEGNKPLSDEERRKFEELLQDKEFRKSFQAMMNPEAAADASIETDEQQQEGEYIWPKPEFVVKTYAKDSKEKIFVNMCSHEKIDSFSLEPGRPTKDSPDAEGYYRIPLSLGQARIESDKEGNPCTVFDCAFNPEVIAAAKEEAQMKQSIITLALSYIQNKTGRAISEDYRIPKMVVKGDTTYQFVRAKNKITEVKKGQDSQQTKALSSAVMPRHTLFLRSEGQPLSQAKEFTEGSFEAFQLRRGEVPAPDEFVLRIKLPMLDNIEDAILELDETELVFESKIPRTSDKYILRLDLPGSVSREFTASAFVAQSKALYVRMPSKRHAETLRARKHLEKNSEMVSVEMKTESRPSANVPTSSPPAAEQTVEPLPSSETLIPPSGGKQQQQPKEPMTSQAPKARKEKDKGKSGLKPGFISGAKKEEKPSQIQFKSDVAFDLE